MKIARVHGITRPGDKANSAAPVRTGGSSGVRFLLGAGRIALGPRDDGLTEAKTQIAKLLELPLAEVGVALRHVLDGVIHPFDLLLFGSTDYLAAVNMAEEFVACTIESASGI